MSALSAGKAGSRSASHEGRRLPARAILRCETDQRRAETSRTAVDRHQLCRRSASSVRRHSVCRSLPTKLK